MNASSFLNRCAGTFKRIIVIGSVALFLPGAFSSEGAPPQPSAKIARSQGLSAHQEEFVPIELADIHGQEASSVTVGELIQRIPRKARKAFERGFKALSQSRPVDGQRFLKEALAMKPDYFQAATSLAALMFNEGEYSASRLYAERALAINPEYPPAMEILGALDVLDGRWPQGISELTEALRYLPNRDVPHFYLGVALRHMGKCEEGSRQLQTAIYLSSHPTVHFRHAFIPDNMPSIIPPTSQTGSYP